MDREKGAGNTEATMAVVLHPNSKQFCSYSPVDLVAKGHIISTLESSGATASGHWKPRPWMLWMVVMMDHIGTADSCANAFIGPSVGV